MGVRGAFQRLRTLEVDARRTRGCGYDLSAGAVAMVLSHGSPGGVLSRLEELHLRGMGGDVRGGCSCLEAVLAAARQRGAPLARLTALGVDLGRRGEQRQVEELAAALKGGALFPALRKLTLQVHLGVPLAPWRIELEREAARRSVQVEWLHTDLHAAAMVGDARSVSTLLLEAGCDKDKACEIGATPAFIAAHKGHADCLRLLLEAGCDMEKATQCGSTPIVYAEKAGQTDCLSILTM